MYGWCKDDEPGDDSAIGPAVTRLHKNIIPNSAVVSSMRMRLGVLRCNRPDNNNTHSQQALDIGEIEF